jgi:hypothetical protein
MSSIYKCGTCGVVSDERGHLCEPEKTASWAEFCSSGPEHVSQICEEIDRKLEFQYFTSGRPTDKPDLFCNPTPLR